ncbi:MAG: zinc ribbon domain-containing protein [Bacilli bacterium]|nr:zinc ribbon domain-containing protein [Bacilli bacterium]
MSLNYCPNCGRRLEGNTKYCPYCGAYLEENNVEKVYDGFSMNTPPKDPSWVNKWNDRARKNKIVILVVFLILMPALLIPMFVMLFDLGNTLGDDIGFIWPLIFMLLLVVLLFAWAVATVIKRKNIIKVIDGYTVLVFITNSQHALIIEDEMQASQAIHNSRYCHTRPINLYGHLPNGRKIYVDFENKVNGIQIRFED